MKGRSDEEAKILFPFFNLAATASHRSNFFAFKNLENKFQNFFPLFKTNIKDSKQGTCTPQ
jgi:hypothetical protein